CRSITIWRFVRPEVGDALIGPTGRTHDPIFSILILQNGSRARAICTGGCLWTDLPDRLQTSVVRSARPSIWIVDDPTTPPVWPLHALLTWLLIFEILMLLGMSLLNATHSAPKSGVVVVR